jgi:hypothetical protein
VAVAPYFASDSIPTHPASIGIGAAMRPPSTNAGSTARSLCAAVAKFT